jgi:tripartite ATP-independent transporter DctP family solute receptor
MAKFFTRRSFLGTVAAASGMATFGILTEKSKAAEFEFKIGNDVPDTHPMNVRLREAIARIREQTGGRLVFNLFPNNQLGGDTVMLSQLRSGALECFNLSPIILSTLIPAVSIPGLAYAFKDYGTAFRAMDGELGDHVRAATNKAGIDCFKPVWNNDFRNVLTGEKAIKAAGDLRNLKIRVPVSPLWLSYFKAMGASAVGLNWNETYSALQTKIVDGVDSSLPNADLSKMYEVQKYCAMTNHMWDCYMFLLNRKSWSALPTNLQEIAEKNFTASCLTQRDDYPAIDASLRPQLEAKGLTFTTPDREEFKAELTKANYYADWRKQYGSEAWEILQKYSGPLG